MYYGHIRTGAVALNDIMKMGRGYSVEYQIGQRQFTSSLTQVLDMIEHIPDYKISGTFYSKMEYHRALGDRLSKVIDADLASGKCTGV